MGFNIGLNAMSYSRMATMGVSESLGRLDIQNALRFANVMLPPSKSKKALSGKRAEDFKHFILTLLDWESILGNGFTARKPEKLQKYLDLYIGKKYHKLQKYILKNFDDNDDMSDKELESWCQDYLYCLANYVELVKEAWKDGDKKLFTRLDRDYYNYAKEEYDSILDECEEE